MPTPTAELRDLAWDKEEFARRLEQFKHDKTRQGIFTQILARVPSGKVLILQHRPTETGCVLFPEELDILRKKRCSRCFNLPRSKSKH